jgi:hypothetical protein
LKEIKEEFQFSKSIETDIIIDNGHGRIETRKCNDIINLSFVENEKTLGNL